MGWPVRQAAKLRSGKADEEWGEEGGRECNAGASRGAQREVMSLSALSSSSLMALYFIFCAYTSSAGGGGERQMVEQGGGQVVERERKWQ